MQNFEKLDSKFGEFSGILQIIQYFIQFIQFTPYPDLVHDEVPASCSHRSELQLLDPGHGSVREGPEVRELALPTWFERYGYRATVSIVF